MKALYARDKKRRELVIKYWVQRQKLKNLKKRYPTKEWVKLLESLPVDSSNVRVKNRCILTYSARAVFKEYKLNRMMFKEKIESEEIKGIKRAKW